MSERLTQECRAEIEREFGTNNRFNVGWWTPAIRTLLAEIDRLNNVIADQEPLTFEKFSLTNRRRCESLSGFNHALDSWSTSDWIVAVTGELGEAANVVKKLNRIRDGIPGNKETEDELQAKLRRELADTFIYLDLLAQSLGTTIGDMIAEVFDAKSEQIGYPLRLKPQ